jgi:hypothetical protein
MMDYANGWINGTMGRGMQYLPIIGLLVVVLLIVLIIKVSKK